MYIKEGTLKQTPSAEGAQKRMGDPIWFGRIPAGSLEEVAGREVGLSLDL